MRIGCRLQFALMRLDATLFCMESAAWNSGFYKGLLRLGHLACGLRGEDDSQLQSVAVDHNYKVVDSVNIPTICLLGEGGRAQPLQFVRHLDSRL